MNHGELRTKVHEHFTEVLKKAKARRDELGPYTELEKERIADTIRHHEADNEDYWDVLGRDYARSELDKFCNGAGVEQPKTREDAFLILGEIKKAQLALANALLEHDKTFEKYDFGRQPSARVSAPESGQPSSDTVPAKVAKKPTDALSSPLLSILFAERKAEAEQTGQWSAKLLNDYQAWADLFIELQGDRPVLDYKKNGRTRL